MVIIKARAVSNFRPNWFWIYQIIHDRRATRYRWGHPVYTGVSIDKHRVHRIRVRARLREGNCKQLRANKCTNTYAPYTPCVIYTHTNGGCIHNSRARRRIRCFFPRHSANLTRTDYEIWAFRDCTKQMAREERERNTRLFVYDKQKYRPEFSGCNVTYARGLNCL